MSEEWNKHNKKGYLKIHLAVDIRTKQILALEVTDEKIHDGKVMRRLVNNILNLSEPKTVIKIKSVLADGAFDSNANFQYLKENKIQPGIKVR